jgi:hypothetical protein
MASLKELKPVEIATLPNLSRGFDFNSLTSEHLRCFL